MAKRRPTPPFLELNFYFSARHPMDLTDFVAGLVAGGARFSGVAYVERAPGMSEHPTFPYTFKEGLDTVNIDTLEEWLALRNDPDLYPANVVLQNVTGIGGAEIVTYLRGARERNPTERAVIAIWTSGDSFSGTTYRNLEAAARRDGRKAYQQFIKLVKRFDPDYGAITVEWGLETPGALAKGESSLAFSNCYLRHELLEGIELPNSAYIEALPHGRYISGYGNFNPKGRRAASEEMSAFMKAAIRSIARRLRHEA